MKRNFLILYILFSVLILWGQEPAGYYNAANGKKGRALRVALSQIISQNFHSVGYSGLWNAFPQTDAKANGKVWDIYSDLPGGTPPYEFTFGDDKCGSYSKEGDCYNREHSIPASWFDDQNPMYSDLFHIYPTDGFVNNKRGNLPFGEVNSPSWTSKNGSKLGPCATAGCSGNAFEPIDEYKGDLARSYFYMCTRYMDKNFGQVGGSMFNGGNLDPWALNMLIRWHQNDPVSQKEIDRNNNIYSIQHNRNPFIDHPDLVGKIFGADSINAFVYGSAIQEFINNDCAVYPNPANTEIHIQLNYFSAKEYCIYDSYGKIALRQNYDDFSNENSITCHVQDLPSGVYILKLVDNQQNIIIKKIIIQHQ